MSTLVRLFMVAIPLAVIIVGLVQLNALRAVPGRLTRTPFVVALAFAGIVAIVVEGALAGLAGMDVGVRAEHYLWALPFALGAGVVVLLAGLAGFGILAKAHLAPRLALLGIFLLPVVLGLCIQVIGDYAGTVDESDRAAIAAREQAHVADLCSTLTVNIDVVAVGHSTNGIDRLTIDLVFVGVDDVAFEPGGFVTANAVASVMILPDLFSKLTTDVPILLRAGEPSKYRIVLAPRPGDGLPEAGEWQSEIWPTRTDGETYACPVPFVVPPTRS